MKNSCILKGSIFFIIFSLVGMSFAAGFSDNIYRDAKFSNFMDNITFYPSDDAYIGHYYPNRIYGLDNPYELKIMNDYGSTPGWAYNTLIRFDVSSIPSGSIINSAQLSIYHHEKDDNNPAGRPIKVYRILNSWNENTVTWNTQPSYSASTTDTTNIPSSPGQWMSCDVTSDVQDFIDGINTNYGWEFTDETYWGGLGIPRAHFRSKDYVSNKPKLVINYTPLENDPPNTPSAPSGPTSGIVGVQYPYSVSTTDPDGDYITYGWDSNGNDLVDWWSDYHPSGESCDVYITFNTPGTRSVQVKAEDEHGAQSGFSPTLNVVITDNDPPNTPDTPTGPSSLSTDESGEYYTSATDPDGHQVQYRFDWDSSGGHDYSSWTTLGSSGHTASKSHSWAGSGTYLVKVQARDEYGSIGPWSSGKTVTVSGANERPNTPATPTGPSSLETGESGEYSTSATDPDGDQVQYRFDWDADGAHDYSSWTPLGTSGHSDSKSHSWVESGTYTVKVQARDEHGSLSYSSSGKTVVITSGENVPPSNPNITGIHEGKTGISYTYSAVSLDPNGDKLYYLFDWGDGSDSGWVGTFDSGIYCNESHVWDVEGDFVVKVKAKDVNAAESDWSSFEITMPKNKAINTPFIRFLENHPYMFPLLRQLLGL